MIRGGALLERVRSLPFGERDAWVDEWLGLEAPPADEPLPHGAVPYLPCGVDEILAAVREAPIGPRDELVDLGSGLGRVVLLAHLVSGARCRGIELQASLVERARAKVAELGLADVSFVHGNAAELALDGTVFFLYAPCNGAMLAAVLDRLAEVARRRSIVIAAVGVEFHDVSWLRARRTSCPALTLYDAAP